MFFFKNVVGFLFVLTLLIVACEENQLEPVPEKERTYLRVLNAYSSDVAIDIDIQSFGEKKQVAENLFFKNAWPKSGYASLLAPTFDQDTTGETTNFVIDFYDHIPPNALLVPQYSVYLYPERKLSVCLVDSFGKPMVVRIPDNFLPPRPGNANFRFMNISHRVLSASLIAKNDTLKIDRLNFLNYSTFKQFPAKTYTFYFIDDFTGRHLDSIPNLEVRPGQTLRFFLVNQQGKPSGGYEILE